MNHVHAAAEKNIKSAAGIYEFRLRCRYLMKHKDCRIANNPLSSLPHKGGEAAHSFPVSRYPFRH